MEQSVVIKPPELSISLGHKLTIWASAKTFLQHVIRTMDSIYQHRTESVQKEIYLAFYGNKEYAEALDSVPFDFLASTFKIIADTNELRKSEGNTYVTQTEEVEVFGDSNETFDANNPNVAHQVASEWIESKQTICFESVYPVLQNKELLDLISRLKIDFKSNKEPHLSELISSAILHVAKSGKNIKHGNPNIGNRISNVADEFAKEIGPILDKLDEEGVKTTRDKAKELNRRKIKTLRGNDWFSSTVQRTYSRWQEIKSPKL